MTQENKSKGIHIALWVAQGLLAFAFGMAGFMKMTTPIAQLAQNGMGFVHHYSEGMVRFIGIVEVLGAFGLILPAALRIKPVLTPLAAVGTAVVMIMAFLEHVSQNEPFVPNIVLFALSVFVVWGRIIKAPIQAK